SWCCAFLHHQVPAHKVRVGSRTNFPYGTNFFERTRNSANVVRITNSWRRSGDRSNPDIGVDVALPRDDAALDVDHSGVPQLLQQLAGSRTTRPASTIHRNRLVTICRNHGANRFARLLGEHVDREQRSADISEVVLDRVADID